MLEAALSLAGEHVIFLFHLGVGEAQGSEIAVFSEEERIGIAVFDADQRETAEDGTGHRAGLLRIEAGQKADAAPAALQIEAALRAVTAWFVSNGFYVGGRHPDFGRE